MKRVALLISILLLFISAALAEEGETYTWKIDPAVAAFAAQHVPGYEVVDGCIFDQTAMLLLADSSGQVFFAGCVRNGDAWTVTLSTPLPEWAAGSLDTFHAGEGGITVWLDLPPEYRAYEDSDSIFVVVELQPDGTWRAVCINTGREVMALNRCCVYLDVGVPIYGDIPMSLDITELDWAALPRSFEQAIAWVDTSRWMIVAGNGAPVHVEDSPDSEVISLGAAGAPMRLLSAREDMVQVTDMGGSITGWMNTGDLLPASEQMVWDNEWEDWDNRFMCRELILVIWEEEDPPVSWYAVAHQESTAVPFPGEYVESLTLLGWCAEGCCYHLYSETLGTSAFVPISQCPYIIE